MKTPEATVSLTWQREDEGHDNELVMRGENVFVSLLDELSTRPVVDGVLHDLGLTDHLKGFMRGQLGTMGNSEDAIVLRATIEDEDVMSTLHQTALHNTIRGSLMHLLHTAIYKAKTDGGEVVYDANTWTDAALEEDVLASQPKGNFIPLDFESITGISDRDQQRLVLSRLAGKVAISPVLATPQDMFWRGDVVTMQASQS